MQFFLSQDTNHSLYLSELGLLSTDSELQENSSTVSIPEEGAGGRPVWTPRDVIVCSRWRGGFFFYSGNAFGLDHSFAGLLVPKDFLFTNLGNYSLTNVAAAMCSPRCDQEGMAWPLGTWSLVRCARVSVFLDLSQPCVSPVSFFQLTLVGIWRALPGRPPLKEEPTLSSRHCAFHCVPTDHCMESELMQSICCPVFSTPASALVLTLVFCHSSY